MRYSETGGQLSDVLWNGAQFVAVGDHGAVLTSPDGVAWQASNAGTAETLFAVAWNGSSFTAVGAHGARFESADAVSWSAVESSTANDLYGVRWEGGRLLAFGRFGSILGDSCGAQRGSVGAAVTQPGRRAPRAVGR
jgi:hypothetical protein